MSVLRFPRGEIAVVTALLSAVAGTFPLYAELRGIEELPDALCRTTHDCPARTVCSRERRCEPMGRLALRIVVPGPAGGHDWVLARLVDRAGELPPRFVRKDGSDGFVLLEIDRIHEGRFDLDIVASNDGRWHEPCNGDLHQHLSLEVVYGFIDIAGVRTRRGAPLYLARRVDSPCR